MAPCILLKSTLVFMIASIRTLGTDGAFSDETRGRYSPRQIFMVQNFDVLINGKELTSTSSSASLSSTPNGNVLGPLPFSILKSSAMNLLTQMEKAKQDESIKKLQNEIHQALNEGGITPLWLIDMHFRWLTLIGNLSAEEKEYFTHLPHSEYFQALHEKDQEGRPLVVHPYQWGVRLGSLGPYFHFSQQKLPTSSNLLPFIRKAIDQEVERSFPAPIFVPRFEEDSLDPGFLFSCWINHVYTVRISPQKPQSAFEDLLHFKKDARRESLKQVIYSKIPYYTNENGLSSDFITHLVPLMMQKYNGIMNVLEDLGTQLKTRNEEFALMALSLLTVDAFTSFNSIIFDGLYPETILGMMIEEALSKLDKPESWINATDYFQTSPIDGTMNLGAEKIKEIVVHTALEDPTFPIPDDAYITRNTEGRFTGYVIDKGKKKKLKERWISENMQTTINNTSQFVDVLCSLKNGQKITYSFPTLYLKLKYIRPFLMAFKNLEIPRFSGENKDQDHTQAIKFLETVRGRMKGALNDLAAKASEVFRDPEGAGYSYNKEFDEIHQQLKRIKPSKPLPKKREGENLEERPKKPSQDPLPFTLPENVAAGFLAAGLTAEDLSQSLRLEAEMEAKKSKAPETEVSPPSPTSPSLQRFKQLYGHLNISDEDLQAMLKDQ